MSSTVAMPITTSAWSNAVVESTLMAALPVTAPFSPDPDRKESARSRRTGTAALDPASPTWPAKATATSWTRLSGDR